MYCTCHLKYRNKTQKSVRLFLHKAKQMVVSLFLRNLLTLLQSMPLAGLQDDQPVKCLQAKIPFNEEELNYIAGLNAEADVEFLRQELPWLPEGSLRTLQVSNASSLTLCCSNPNSKDG